MTVALVGGAASNEGYLYATNPATGIYGPVCDDYFTMTSVSLLGSGFWRCHSVLKLHIPCILDISCVLEGLACYNYSKY